MSFDLEALLRYEDRKQAFRTSRNNCVSEDTGKREPDWTAFEGVFARGKKNPPFNCIKRKKMIYYCTIHPDYSLAFLYYM